MNIVPLLEGLVNGLIAAEEKFFDNPKDFYLLESSVKSATDSFAAGFLSSLLESMNELIYKDGFRKPDTTSRGMTDARPLRQWGM